MFKLTQTENSLGLPVYNITRLSDGKVFEDCLFGNGYAYNAETIENGICCFEDLI